MVGVNNNNTVSYHDLLPQESVVMVKLFTKFRYSECLSYLVNALWCTGNHLINVRTDTNQTYLSDHIVIAPN